MTIETKYNIGDEVWVKAYAKATKCKVTGINFCKWGEMYENLLYTILDTKNCEYYDIEEKCLYPTKEELLKSL